MRSEILICGLGVASVLALTGCGRSDGTKEFAAGEKAMQECKWEVAAREFAAATDCLVDPSEAYLNLATAYVELGKMNEANDAVSSAMAITPSNTARLMSGRVSFHLSDYRKAREMWNAVIASADAGNAEKAEAWNALGVLEMTVNDKPQMRDLARVCFLRATRLDFKNAQAWYHLGKLYRERYQFDEAALDMYKIYARLAPATDSHLKRVKEGVIPDLTTAVSSANSELASAKRAPGKCAVLITDGDKLSAKQQFKGAAEKYQKAAEADPTSVAAFARLGKILEKTEKTAEGRDRAVKAYKTAAKLSSNTAYFVSAARLALKLGHFAEAGSVAGRGLARNPTSAALVDVIVEAYAKQGEKSLSAEYRAYRAMLDSAK